MKLVERGENDWKRKIGTVSMTIWVKNQKIKKKKKKSWSGVRRFFLTACFASLPLYAVGGAIVLFLRVTGRFIIEK